MKKYLWIIIPIVLIAIVLINAATTKKTKTVANTTNTNTVIAPKYDQTLELSDFTFSPKEFTVGPSQTIKVLLKNTGKSAHTFNFDKLDFSYGTIEAGQSKTVVFTVPTAPGSYGFHSTGSDPKDKDMAGTMVVK